MHESYYFFFPLSQFFLIASNNFEQFALKRIEATKASTEPLKIRQTWMVKLSVHATNKLCRGCVIFS